MSEAPRKQEADLTKECDEIIPIAQSLADDGKLQESLDKFMSLEKQTRNAADLASTSRVLIAVTSTLWKHKEYEQLNAHLSILARKHGQLRQAVVKMVEHAMSYLDQLDGRHKLQLIEALREVTEGKIYLEVQRARVTRMLAHIKENQDHNVTEASNLLQDLQVETFGSMNRKEKVDFILEQMRLLRLQKDWEKLAIVAKRINIKWLADKDHEEMKLRYYALMIQWGLHEEKYLDVCKFYRSILETPSVAEDDSKWPSVLRNVVFFVILAPYDNEQNDLLQRVYKDERLPKLAESHDLLKCFTTPELMRWPGIESLHGPSLRRTRVFATQSSYPTASSTTSTTATTSSSSASRPVPSFDDIEQEDDTSRGEKRWQVLHDRVVEHNIRTVASYYTRITLDRLAGLLDLDADRAERHLAKLVVDKTVWARIDRIDRSVSFVRPRSGEEVLNDWSSDVSKLMGLIDKSCHLIAKEQAVHAALQAKKSLKA